MNYVHVVAGKNLKDVVSRKEYSISLICFHKQVKMAVDMFPQTQVVIK